MVKAVADKIKTYHFVDDVRYGEEWVEKLYRLRNIAGIVNEQRNIMGLMPHPERAAHPLLGNTEGLVILKSLLSSPTLSLTS